MRIVSAAVLVPCLLAAVGVAHARASEPSGQTLAFASARAGLCLFEPRVAFSELPVRIVAGDALEFDVLVPGACAERAGVEIVFRDGPRTQAPLVAECGAWRHVRIALDDFVQYESMRFELVARGKLAGEIGYRVDNVAITHASGEPSIVFADELEGGATIVRDDRRQSGAAVVPLASAFDGVGARLDGVTVGEPWNAYDLATLRRASDAEPGSIGPFGAVLAGPCVPLRFARRGERASIASDGQRFLFEPLEGGRFYTAWLALSTTDGAALTARGFAFGEAGERQPIEIRVPRHGDTASDATDLGSCVLVAARLASVAHLTGIELPREPRLRVHALTFQWHKDGGVDEEFTTAWLREQSRTSSAATLGFAESLARWADDRELGPSFANDVIDRAAELEMFNALLRGNLEEFQAALTRETQRQAARGEPLKKLNVALEDVRAPRAGVRLDGSVDGETLLRALRDAAAAGSFVLEGDPSTLRQAPQILSALDVDSAFLAGGPRLGRWVAPDGSSVVVYTPFRVLSDARGFAELPWRQWTMAVGMKAATPELFLAVDGSSRARADAADIVKRLGGLAIAPGVRLAAAEEFAAQSGTKLGAECPEFVPGPKPALEDEEAQRGVERAAVAGRLAEVAYALSMFATPAHFDGSSYPRASVDELRGALRTFAGSGTPDDVDGILWRADGELARQLSVLARGADTAGDGTPIVAFNTLAWTRTTLVESEGSEVLLSRTDKTPVPWQATARGTRLFALALPAFGYQVVRGVPGEGPVRIDDRERVQVEEWTARNARLSFTLDPASGALASLKLAGVEREFLAAPAQLAGEGWKVESAEFTEKGPLRAVARVVMTNEAGRVELEYRLAARSSVVEVEARNAGDACAWRLGGTQAGTQALFGAPYGWTSAVARADGKPARHGIADWAAWTSDDGDIGILAADLANVLVERDALAPELASARTTRFALLPFAGAWRAAGLAQRAAEIRSPFVLVPTDVHAGARQPRHSFVRVARVEGLGRHVEGPECGVALTAFEPEPEGRACLVRLVETQGVAGTVVLDFDRPVFGAELVDLRGANKRELKVDQRRVEILLRADRIETVRVRLRP